MTNKPQGVVAVFIDDAGRSVFVASDFDNGGAAGFSKKEMQKIRAKQKLYRMVVDGYSSPQLSRAICNYKAESIVQELCNNHKCKIHFEYINHGDE